MPDFTDMAEIGRDNERGHESRPWLQRKAELEDERRRKYELEAERRGYEIIKGTIHELSAPVDSHDGKIREMQESNGEEVAKELDAAEECMPSLMIPSIIQSRVTELLL